MNKEHRKIKRNVQKLIKYNKKLMELKTDYIITLITINSKWCFIYLIIKCIYVILYMMFCLFSSITPLLFALFHF